MTGFRSGFRLPAWDDPGFWQRYWDDVRPRFLFVSLRAERFRFGWGIPLSVVEDLLRFVLLALPWFGYAWRGVPKGWRDELARPDRRWRIAVDPPRRAPWPALVALLEGHGEGMLRLPPGEPFVVIEAGNDVHIAITQV
jgi:hypothetical protein